MFYLILNLAIHFLMPVLFKFSFFQTTMYPFTQVPNLGVNFKMFFKRILKRREALFLVYYFKIKFELNQIKIESS